MIEAVVPTEHPEGAHKMERKKSVVETPHRKKKKGKKATPETGKKNQRSKFKLYKRNDTSGTRTIG